MSNSINEGNTAYLTATFKNKLGVAEQPTSVSYSVTDMNTGNVVRASTAIAAAAAVEITLTSDDTAIQDASHSTEIRRVTVIGVYGAGDQVSAQFDFTVINLSGI